MLPLSPFTYLLEGLLGNVLGPQAVRCAQNEFNIIEPPAGQTCEAFLSPYFAGAFGYFEQRPDGNCQVCQYSRGEDFLTGLSTSDFTFSSSHRWRNLVSTSTMVVIGRCRSGCSSNTYYYVFDRAFSLHILVSTLRLRSACSTWRASTTGARRSLPRREAWRRAESLLIFLCKKRPPS